MSEKQDDRRDGFAPGDSVTWIQSPGGRRNMRRNFFAGLSREVPAKVVSVGAKFVTIEAEGQTHKVKARNLKIESEAV